MQTLSQADAKNDFLRVCRGVLSSDGAVRIADKGKAEFMTLTADEPIPALPVLTMSAQDFKDRFSRCASLIRIGLVFRLTIRGETRCVFAIRSLNYESSTDPLMKKWRESVELESFKLLTIHNQEAIISKRRKRLKSYKEAVAFANEQSRQLEDLMALRAPIEGQLLDAVRVTLDVMLRLNGQGSDTVAESLKEHIESITIDAMD